MGQSSGDIIGTDIVQGLECGNGMFIMKCLGLSSCVATLLPIG